MNKIKTYLHLFLLFGLLQTLSAQENSGYRILRSNLGSSGSSSKVETPKGMYKISQSIGQSSVIGTHYNNGYYLRQGYQQPLQHIKILKETDNELKAKVYPNPFREWLTISFSTLIKESVSVSICDIKGKQIYLKEFNAAQEIDITIGAVESGTYLLKVLSQNKSFNTKLIKL